MLEYLIYIQCECNTVPLVNVDVLVVWISLV